MTALRSEFLEHWEAVLLSVPEHYTEEFRRSVDALIEETRRDCFVNSPLSIWLVQSTTDRFAFAEYDESSKRIRVDLHDVGADDEHEDEPVARGFGESVEEAIGDALNQLEAEAH